MILVFIPLVAATCCQREHFNSFEFTALSGFVLLVCVWLGVYLGFFLVRCRVSFKESEEVFLVALWFFLSNFSQVPLCWSAFQSYHGH